MKGRQRLKFAHIGEVHRRWARIAAAGDLDRRYGSDKPEEVCSEERSEEVEWSSSFNSPRGTTDLLFGVRPDGSRARFWEDDTASMDSMNSQAISLSTTSLCRKARDAGFSLEQIDATTKLLADSESGHLTVSALSPSMMNQPTAVARKIVSTLFRDHTPASGVWKGPLPKPRVSPSFTFGDCPVIDRRSGSRCHQQSPVSDLQRKEILNLSSVLSVLRTRLCVCGGGGGYVRYMYPSRFGRGQAGHSSILTPTWAV